MISKLLEKDKEARQKYFKQGSCSTRHGQSNPLAGVLVSHSVSLESTNHGLSSRKEHCGRSSSRWSSRKMPVRHGCGKRLDLAAA